MASREWQLEEFSVYLVAGEQLEVQRFEVLKHERHGPWLRRAWAPIDGEPEIMADKEVVTQVDLPNGVLPSEDLYKLKYMGVHAVAGRHDKQLLARCQHLFVLLQPMPASWHAEQAFGSHYAPIDFIFGFVAKREKMMMLFI